MATKKPARKAPVVSILNMKGGVGKTTITANVFRLFYLALDKNVLLIDLDPQFNLTQTLYTQAEYEIIKRDKKTVLSVMEDVAAASLFDLTKGKKNPPKTGEIAKLLRHRKEWHLDLIPGDFDMVKYSLSADTDALNNAQKRFSAFVESASQEYDLVCIDCNPSSSFLTKCAIYNSTHILVPVKPDRYSILGLKLLDTYISSFNEIVKKPEMIVLLNNVPRTDYDATIENDLRSDRGYGPRTLATPLYETKLLRAEPDYTGFATDKRVPRSKTLRNNILAIIAELQAILKT